MHYDVVGERKIAILNGRPKGADILAELLGTNGDLKVEKAGFRYCTYPEKFTISCGEFGRALKKMCCCRNGSRKLHAS